MPPVHGVPWWFGADYIGLEVAEGLLQRGLRVTVVERLDAPIGAVLDANMAIDLAGAMTAAGIDLRLGTAVTGFTVITGRVKAVETTTGRVAADLVVIGLGIRGLNPAENLSQVAAGAPAGCTRSCTCSGLPQVHRLWRQRLGTGKPGQ